MARRVFVHIGAPKSGTSYLQDRFARNVPLLAHHGLHYVETFTGDHFPAALDLIERPWAGQLNHARGQWDDLVETAAQYDGDVLVSHEILAAARPEQVERALASFPEDEVHIVLTVRDLARQLPAEWQEEVKHRRAASFDTFSKRVINAPRVDPELWFWRVQAIPDVLARWGKNLPAQRIHVVTVPPSGAPPETLWERFASVVGIPLGLTYAAAEVHNASLGTAEVAVLRRLNRRLRRAGVMRDTYVPYVRELIVQEVFAAHPEIDKLRLPAQLRGFVDELASEWQQWLRDSGVDVVGDLDDLRPRWPDGPVSDPDEPSTEAVADAAIEALAAVLTRLDRERRLAAGVPQGRRRRKRA